MACVLRSLYEFAFASVPPFCGLPPPELFSLGLFCAPPSCASLALLTPGLLGLTSKLFPPPSFSACWFSPSGDVLLESKAAFDCAASPSEPDLEYSLEATLMESLSWESFRAKEEGVELKQRWASMGWGLQGWMAKARSSMRREAWQRYMVSKEIVGLVAA